MRISPLWRRAALRPFTGGGAALLLGVAMLAATTSAAALPLFAEMSGSAALSTVLDAVPDSARASDASSVRLVGGVAPDAEGQKQYVDRLRAIPGLLAPTTTGVSVGPEVHRGQVHRPVVAHGGEAVRARLTAVEDPAGSVVPVGPTIAAARPVWLPAPVAERLGVEVGDPVTVYVERSNPGDPPPKVAVPIPRSVLTVAGIYAVGPDGRRPLDPAGTTSWSRRKGGLPTDSDLSAQPAFLLVTDVATAARAAAVIEDSMLWAVESDLAPGIRLDGAERAAEGVADLRTTVRAPTDEPAGILRTGVVSGLEVIVAEAVSLRDATVARGRLLAGAGVAAGLLAVVGLAVVLAAERRRELRHGAGVGVGAVRTAGLWTLESVLPAAAAAVAGWGVAVSVMSVAGPDGTTTSAVVRDAFGDAARTGALAALLVGLVGAIGCAVARRPAAAEPRRRPPWVLLLCVVAATATIAALTAAPAAPGPLDLAVPALLAAATGAAVATGAAALVRRGAGRGRATGRASSTSRWLAVRRLAVAGQEQVLTVAVIALGLGMVLFASTAVQATRVAVADRTAVAAGAQTRAQLVGSWALDPDAPRAPTYRELAAGAPVPEARTPEVPEGSTLVWRTLVGIQGEFGYREVLVVDPAELAAVADWGEGSAMAELREKVLALAAADAAIESGEASGSYIPAIAIAEPSVATGDQLTVSGQGWSDQVEVVATAPMFFTRESAPMLVMPRSAFRAWAANDPRLAPSEELTSPRTDADAWVWSHDDAASLTEALEQRGAAPTAVRTIAEAAAQPALIAAESALGFQQAVAGFLGATAIVAAAVHARRARRRGLAVDLLLARVGLGRRGVVAARMWELALVVLLGAASALAAVLLVAPVAAGLLDLDPRALPAYEFRLGAVSAGVLVLITLVALLVAWGVALPRRLREDEREEVVLRAGA